ncbi:MAG TPA: hypothetical protein VJT11_11770 [Nitrospiraceae bacterium]|nr:hypothetical protein [Nitrospiraceae bacterium]
MREIFALIALSTLLVSCSGGGGGDGGGGSSAAPSITVSGSVQAPNGQIALEHSPGLIDQLDTLFFSKAFASISGLSPVPDGTQVQLARFNATGTSFTTIVSTTTTGGTYFFNLTDLGLQLSNDLFLRVANGAVQMRAFVVGSTANVDPVSEAAVQMVIDDYLLITPGVTLTQFTTQELNDLVGSISVLAIARQIAAAGNIASSVLAIKASAKADSGFIAFFNAAASNGQTSQGPGDIGNFFPLNQGNIWKFQGARTETGQTTTHYTTTTLVDGVNSVGGVNALVIKEDNPENSGVPQEDYFSKNSHEISQVGTNDASDLLTPQLIPYPLIRFPLQPGSTFQQFHKRGVNVGDLEGDGKNDTADITSQVTVVGPEAISVPAGAFPSALRVESVITTTVHFSFNGSHGTVSQKNTAWYAPEVGPVRQMLVTQGPSLTISRVEDLIKFIPAFNFSLVTPGISHTCGITTAGKAYCWGENDFGALGNGTNVTSILPVEVSGELTFSYIGAGANYSCGLTTGGQAYCWGRGAGGRLGNGGTTDSTTPVTVAGNLTFMSLSVAGTHTCGVTTTRVGYCWGDDSNGGLGSGILVPSGFASSPVMVSGGVLFNSISPGFGSTTCAVSTTGQGYCWGNAEGGALGNGTFPVGPTPTPTPQLVSGPLPFLSITTGSAFSCGLVHIGEAYCWGTNWTGQLGNGHIPFLSDIPTPVSGGLTFTSLSAGGSHVCGITVSGGSYCWGDNGSAQLGTGTTIMSSVPIPLGGSVGFASIRAGAQYTCGTASESGRPYCWGDFFHGKLGYPGGNQAGTGINSLPFPVSPPQ